MNEFDSSRRRVKYGKQFQFFNMRGSELQAQAYTHTHIHTRTQTRAHTHVHTRTHAHSNTTYDPLHT